MRITIVNRYFEPEPVLVNDIALWLAEAGHEVEVICSQPSYNPESNLPRQPKREILRGVQVRRLGLLPEKNRGLARYVNSILFILLASLAVLFGRRADVVWSTSIPPVLQPFMLRVASAVRRSRFIYFVQDIYPEIAITMGMARPSWFTRLVSAVDQWTIARADTTVVLSSDMIDALRQRGDTSPQLVSINNFAIVDSAAEAMPLPPGPCRFVFAGNIGRFQNLDRLVDLFADIDPSIAVLEFLGEGRMKQTLRDQVATGNIGSVRFHPQVTPAEAAAFIGQCHVGVISLTETLYRYAYPSKTFAYLGAGIPVLALIEAGSQLAREVAEREIGIAIDWSVPREQQLALIRRLCVAQSNLRRHIHQRSADMYDRGLARDRWLAVFAALQPAVQS